MVQKVLCPNGKLFDCFSASVITCEDALSDLKFKSKCCTLLGRNFFVGLGYISHFFEHWHPADLLYSLIIYLPPLFAFINYRADFLFSLQGPRKILGVVTVDNREQPVGFLVWLPLKEPLQPHVVCEQPLDINGLVDLVLEFFASRPSNGCFKGFVLTQAVNFHTTGWPVGKEFAWILVHSRFF